LSFLSLLCHLAQVQVCDRTNVDGRITETWNTRGIIPCRFTQPSSGTVTIVTGATAELVDATVFAGPELHTLVGESTMPARLITEDPGIAGTYEILRPLRLFSRKTSDIHHCECYVRKVQIP